MSKIRGFKVIGGFKMHRKSLGLRRCLGLFLALVLSFQLPLLASLQAQENTTDDQQEVSSPEDVSLESSQSILQRSWEGGVVVFSVLIVLLFFSVLSWALALYKVFSLRKTQQVCRDFLGAFWDHNSLNDFHDKLDDYPLSPIKEAFVSGYDELSKSLPLAAQHAGSYRILRSSMDRIARSLRKSRYASRKDMEVFLLFLAISASVAPFVGLLGTVWGIMNAFEGIAQTGSASLAVVAPGISEALVATAFGLIAAIPAVIGYNIAQHHIRRTLGYVDEFTSDFMNIVERYLVSQPSKNQEESGSSGG